jgi:hypothetical protein
MDEFDPFRASDVAPFRGGRVGEASDAPRPGKGGGRLREGTGGVLAAERRGLSLSIGGGGSTLFLFTPICKLLGCFVAEEPFVAIGGMFAVCVRVGAAGRFDDVGIGGGGLLPKV